jgi:hypothetical protein
MPPLPSSVNSARVAGGLAALPAQSSRPEPQSPVAHANLPAGSVEQNVRPHRRPDHPCGAGIVRDSPGASANPVLSSAAGEFPADRIPGQTVYPQLFVTVNVFDRTPRIIHQKLKRTAQD